MRSDILKLKLYKTTDDDNVINKDLEFFKSININLKDDVDVSNPNIRLKLNIDDIGKFNYAEIDTFNRKYFMNDIQNINNDIWLIRLECDVLETFKDDILNSNAKYLREIRSGDYQEISSEIDVRKDVYKYNSDVRIAKGSDMILSVITGKEG